MENVWLWQIIQYLLVALLPFVAGVLVTYVIKEVKKVEQEDPNTYALLEQFAALCVKAAEQVGVEDKLHYAFNRMQILLDDAGIDLDVDVIAAAIEAAVWDEFNKPPAN